MLLDDLGTMDKDGLFRSNDTFVNYSTGLLPVDFANGFWMTEYDENGEIVKRVPIPGVLGGKLILLFGATGSGKTTLGEQIGYRIIKDFDDGVLVILDAEKTALKERIAAITNHDVLDKRIILNNENTSIEDGLDTITLLCNAKENGGDAYRYTPPHCGYDGKPFKEYVPSVVLIDSLRQFNPRNKDIVSLGTNMDNAREAQAIARFLDNVIDRCSKYNITLIYTNHLQPKIETNTYAPPPPRGLMLEPSSETLPRGTRPLFLAHTAIRANSIKSNMYTKNDVGFEGFMVTLQLAKSKTNYIGATLNVAFNAQKGFDPIFTLYEFANQCGLIRGKNPYLYIEGMQTKFKRSEFITKMTTDKKFNREFMMIIYPYLEALLGAKEVTEDDKLRYGEFTDLPQDEERIVVGEVIDDDFAASLREKKKKK